MLSCLMTGEKNSLGKEEKKINIGKRAATIESTEMQLTEQTQREKVQMSIAWRVTILF